MTSLFNNGYVVKGLYENLFSATRDNYWGIDSFAVWPLRDLDDKISKELEDKAWDTWFSYQDVLEVVPSKEYLIEYTNHCKDLGIETIIIQIETPDSTQVALDNLEVVDVLGFDCITGIQLSYLNLDSDSMKELFPDTYKKLNSKGLCNSIDEVYEFLDRYNQMLSRGVNLEYGEDPVPARLSIVKLP